MQASDPSVSLVSASTLKVVAHKSIGDARWYADSDLFIDECEDWASGNYWTAPLSGTGDNSFFVIDLGQAKVVRGVILKNSKNGVHENA